MSELDNIRPPWTRDQVAQLNLFQMSGVFHPFTCPNRGDGQHERHWHGGQVGMLIATTDGWTCPDCDYTQEWAHAAMADPQILEAQQKFYRDIGIEV